MILSVGLLVLLWGVVLARLPTLWRDGRQRAFWATVGTLALLKTIVLVRPDVPLLLPHLLGVLTAYFLLCFLSLLSGRGLRAWHLALTVAVLAVLVALAGDIRLDGDLPPRTVAYWVVLEGFLGTVLVTTAVLFRSVAGQAPPGFPRLGLWAISAGSAMIALYAAIKTGLILAAPHTDFARFERWAVYLQSGGMLIAVAGACVPAARRSRAILGAYWSLLVLRPLWKAMRDAFPEVILFTPRRAVFELAGVDDVHLRLYRRVIEIRDGMLALRPYLAAEPRTDGDPAEAEAAAIAEALRRHADGEKTAQAGTFAEVGPEMADEVAWLSRVSRAFTDPARTPTPSGSAR
jgi:uncharacterized protein DUF6545